MHEQDFDEVAERGRYTVSTLRKGDKHKGEVLRSGETKPAWTSDLSYEVIFRNPEAPAICVAARNRSSARYQAWRTSGADECDIPYMEFCKAVSSVRKVATRPPTRRENADAEAEGWNKKHPVGTPVRFWPGVREGDGRLGATRSAAWRLCDHASVLVTGYSGGIALTHVEPLDSAKEVAQ